MINQNQDIDIPCSWLPTVSPERKAAHALEMPGNFIKTSGLDIDVWDIYLTDMIN